MGIFNNLIVKGVANFAHTIIGKITNAEKTDLLEWHNKPATGITGRSSWRHLVTDGEVVWGQGWSDSAMDSDSGDLSLWLRKIPGGTDSGTTTINMTLDGQIEALQGFVGTASNANALQGLGVSSASGGLNEYMGKEPNTVARYDQYGYLNTGYIHSAIGNDDSQSIGTVWISNTSDSYMRKVSLDYFLRKTAGFFSFNDLYEFFMWLDTVLGRIDVIDNPQTLQTLLNNTIKGTQHSDIPNNFEHQSIYGFTCTMWTPRCIGHAMAISFSTFANLYSIEITYMDMDHYYYSDYLLGSKTYTYLTGWTSEEEARQITNIKFLSPFLKYLVDNFS